ncbi:hypothetical protein M406DRAFT_89257 [Cryphonectria parasitica EP155]|uniref:EDC4-like protein pdc1 beta-propeller domain-containing protein n=1 Tax=Cryphonectria parasitica (strain ATCC 38755 / EP155) TaxID=660469 RepID=A0A9P5CQV6_CRYP1|nr:uncharacterized protein M406DRAFT_89257 [Cryphonectria parasitica EP155]KAF3766475.1 hypothetical protein M406DRAFT_89257 [Cryphonectria parasitica EP155]
MIHAPAPSSADPTGLLAALMKGKFETEQQSQQTQSLQPSNNWNADPPPKDTQRYLLDLLNRPKPSQSDQPVEAPAEVPAEVPAVPTAPSFDFAPKDVEQLKFEPAQSSQNGSPATKAAMFSHVNPFEELIASASPQNRGPKTSVTPGTPPSIQGQPPIQILKKPGSAHSPLDHKRLSSTSSHLESREHVRRKFDSTPTSQHSNPPYPVRETEDKNKETVAEAVSDIADKVDKEAQEALTRAEDEQTQARITQELRDMMAAKTDQEFEEAAAVAAYDIKHELDKDENSDVLGTTLQPDVAKAVRNIVDSAAQGPVADSWESAEAEDEIVVIEETTKPIRVFNFPMKPWIAINVQDSANDSRPVIRDESILDIARLKKEFDQIDRNLVAASENYLAYGMSKAGGLRVIRQDDGRDAKLFSDTKDRIFNLAISSTPADQHSTVKETIIGTGISGTVYWVQIKDGEKDHLEDAHLEQYGFALPPSSTQEGDAPGGVLKTRARPSTNHPEYFAVGRGKSINIVFPSFVLQRNLLKPSHDRVVDTDRLAKECSLKINTGKAGKDFTFSQDDTVVVSLDKSGRVKFWDVRELTAMDGNGWPAYTSLEVKEPLMTLTTTPEGEKAWPTSVLLLDKFRPYQKRTALRYLIVGMKQNHTLQLWDLALGKPVQEFNLPHSKESDAVCSVMYHPASGIIVVGHPTRNSIYFLHLSAPKYALKNNSQVDYIQKLVAQDPSIAVPDSTAVISGMREYSFANKGVLRSLYLLQQPASAGDGDEATLFELYAMHSKGVACLSIKAPDLGWDRDNKVMDPVNAIEAGVVEIGKLKQPPPQPQAQPAEEAVPAPQVRLAVRPKEPAADTAPELPVTRKAREEASPSKQKESKEEEPAVPAAAEKTEKRGRKKKAAAEKAATLAAALAEHDRETSQTNGTTPRVVATTTHKPAEASKSSFTFSQEVDSRINSMEKRLMDSITGSIQSELVGLRKALDRDAQARDSKFDRRQDELLSQVSLCLNENCQDVLTKIVQDELGGPITTLIGDVLTDAVVKQLDGKLGNTVAHSVQREVQETLPRAMDQALRKPELAKAVSDKVVRTLSNKIDEQLYALLDDRIIPRFTKVATEAASACGKEVLANVTAQFDAMEQIRVKDVQKFEQLVALSTSMSETLSTMSSAQARFQEEILRLQTQLAQQRQVSPAQAGGRHMGQVSQGRGGNGAYHSPSHSQTQALQHLAAPAALPQQHFQSPQGSVAASQYTNPSLAGEQVEFQQTTQENRERLELEDVCSRVRNHMQAGNYDDAVMTWIQESKDGQAVWNQVLAKYDPEFIRNLNPLLLLTVAATITSELDNAQVLHRQLAWTEMVLIQFYEALPRIVSTEGQVREITPRVMSLVKSRLEHVFVRLNMAVPNDPVLRNLSGMIDLTRKINDAMGRSGSIAGSAY